MRDGDFYPHTLCASLFPGYQNRVNLMARFQPLSRRKFLAQTTALTVASSLSIESFAKETMISRVIPGTNEYLPVIGLGAPKVFIEPTDEGAELPKSLIQAVYDHGGRVMDTPAFFKPDVPVFAGYLNELGLQEDMFLIGKITTSGKQEGIDHLDRTIASLNKRPMDTMLIHNFKDVETNWPILEQAKAEGKVRYIGISRTDDVSNETLEKFMREKNPDFVMPGFNMYKNQAEPRILPLAADLGIGVIVVEPFRVIDDGAWFTVTAGKELPEWAADFDCESWAQYALKYIVSNPAVTAVVTETNSLKHVIDNMRAGYGRLPDEATRKRMSEYFFSLL